MDRQLTWTDRKRPAMDALPYIDSIDTETVKMVEKMIAEEMEKSEKKPKDYLNEMPHLGQPSFGGSELLQTEYRRVKAGRDMDPIDTHRYTLPAPAIEKQNDPGEWKKAIENAQAQLEHQRLRALNLELAMKYAPEAWKRGNEQTSRIESSYKMEVESTKEQITEINKRRKLSQTEVGEKLSKLEKEWYHLIAKNFDIRQACDTKRAEISRLRSEISDGQKEQD